MKKSITKQKEVLEDKPARAEFHHGSTTQGAPNSGQGSGESTPSGQSTPATTPGRNENRKNQNK